MGILDRIAGALLQPPSLTQFFVEQEARAAIQKAETRQYAAAKNTRLNSDWVVYDTSADTELHTSHAKLRQLSRAMVRDNPYARRARDIVVQNVIGSGIGLQGNVQSARGKLNDRANDGIEAAWARWARADSCHMGGHLCFADIERMALAEIFEAGEVLIRKHPQAKGRSRVPFALEVIESERLADDHLAISALPGNRVKLGVEVDQFDRPVAYWIRDGHPNEYRQDLRAAQTVTRVPADQIIHLYIAHRWPQVRGVPWLHAVINRLQALNGYTDAEIVRLRSVACVMGFITSPEPPTPDETTGGQGMRYFEPGTIDHLAPGETFEGFSPANSTQIEPIIRVMIREIAAGAGVSYEAISRDYSQSNYSSSKLSIGDDRDSWRYLQRWFIASFREAIHEEWLDMAMLAGAVEGISLAEYSANKTRFQAVRFKPRGWSSIDPSREIPAYREAVLAGFMTTADVVALIGDGADIEDVLKARRQELDLMAQFGIAPDVGAKPATQDPQNATTGTGTE